jgi:hypothetical protein
MIARDDISAIGIAHRPPRTTRCRSRRCSRQARAVRKAVCAERKQAANARCARRRVQYGDGRPRVPPHAAAGLHQELLDGGYIGRFQLCTIELFLDRYVTREPRPSPGCARAEGGGLLGALGSHYIDGCATGSAKSAAVSGSL